MKQKQTVLYLFWFSPLTLKIKKKKKTPQYTEMFLLPHYESNRQWFMIKYLQFITFYLPIYNTRGRALDIFAYRFHKTTHFCHNSRILETPHPQNPNSLWNSKKHIQMSCDRLYTLVVKCSLLFYNNWVSSTVFLIR